MNLGLSLGLGTLRGGGFSPLSLFAAGEQGAWYDPSDISTLFQDSAGTTPVTAAGQSVGLMLDKSQGLVLGPELVTNGDFSSDTAWNKINGATISGGVANLFNAATNPAISQTLNFPLQRTYLVSLTWTGTINAGMGNYGSGDVRFLTNSTAGSWTGYVTLTAGTGATFWVQAPINTATTVDNISVKAIPGNHAIQAVTAARPILRQDGALYYLDFDGTDDSLATAAINFSATDEMSFFAGVRKNSDTNLAVMAELSATIVSNNGAFQVLAPASAGTASYSYASKGTTLRSASYTNAAVAAPVTNVLTGLSDISADSVSLRVNGVEVATSALDQGTGNYGNLPLFIGRRSSASLAFNGRLYSLIVRGQLTAGTDLASAETYVAGKTGVTI